MLELAMGPQGRHLQLDFLLLKFQELIFLIT